MVHNIGCLVAAIIITHVGKKFLVFIVFSICFTRGDSVLVCVLL